MSPRYRGRYRRTGPRRSKTAAQYAREKHVREAEALSSELGGTDRLVKHWFFHASPVQLRSVLDEYGASFGSKAKEYAESALPEWRSGRRRMSGLVAERLFKIIPRHMPAQDRLSIAEALWNHVRPNSSTNLAVNPTMDEGRLIEAVASELLHRGGPNTFVERYRSRFEWLADRDVLALRDILDHIAALERASTVEAIRLQLPMLREQYNANRDIYQQAAHTFRAGKHAVSIHFDDAVSSVELKQPTPYRTLNVPSTHQQHGANTSGGSGCIWAVVITMLVFIVLAYL